MCACVCKGLYIFSLFLFPYESAFALSSVLLVRYKIHENFHARMQLLWIKRAKERKNLHIYIYIPFLLSMYPLITHSRTNNWY